MNNLTEAEIFAFLSAVENGEITLSAVDHPQDVYTGEVVYFASNRWAITICIEDNAWQYIAGLSTDDGREGIYQQIRECTYQRIQGSPHIFETYRPSVPVEWTRYGIPGWGSFRCVEFGTDLLDDDLIHRPAFQCIECGPF